MVEILPWALPYLLAGAAAIWGRTSDRRWLFWSAKPIPVALLILCSTLRPGPPPRWLLAALALCLLGDVLLMLPKRWFTVGLLSFLVGLGAYIVHFSHGSTFHPTSLLVAIAPIGVAAAVVVQLWPFLGRLRFAVIVYVATLVALVWRMLTREMAADVGIASFAWGAAGGILFLVADSLLAWRRFAGRAVPYPVELGTYYLAQWCLVTAALS